MKGSKVWVVLGAIEGLGYAAVKYLVSKEQIVIALTNRESVEPPFFEGRPENLYVIDAAMIDLALVKKILRAVTARHGPIDYIINNVNYRLFIRSGAESSAKLRRTIAVSNAATVKLIKVLLPYLRQEPKGTLINIPPQLCLAAVPGKTDVQRLSHAMETFLTTLYTELKTLDCRLAFLQPGERLADFTV